MSIFEEHELKNIFESAEEKVTEIKEDIQEKIIKSSPKKRRSFWRSLWQIFLFAIIFFVVSYLVINFPALYLNARYFWYHEYKTPKQSAPADASGQVTTTSPRIIKNDILKIPKIDLQTPIIWNVTNEQMTEALRNGVAQFAGTQLPDSQTGPMVLTGHSSNDWWQKGDYNTVFALLNKLVVGDKIEINYKDKVYTYEVFKEMVVSPNDQTVFEPTKDPVLVIATCTPLGTNLRRLLVYAELK